MASLTTRLVRVLSFGEIMQLAQPESLSRALLSTNAPAVQLLGLTILERAVSSVDEAARLGSHHVELVVALVRCWLESPDVGVGQRAGRVLGDLLETDCVVLPPPPPPSGESMANGVPAPQSSAATSINTTLLRHRSEPGRGRLWARILGSREVLSPLLEILTTGTMGAGDNARQMTLAQGRLLRLLPRLAALHWEAVTSAHRADLFAAHVPENRRAAIAAHYPPDPASARPPQLGILHFAALAMVDVDNDVLMHLSLVDFFEALVSITRVTIIARGGEGEDADDEEDEEERVKELGRLLRAATENDERLQAALVTLPDRTVPEEADALRAWLGRVFTRPQRTVEMR